ncbi:MAG: hypothetical protein OEL76_01785 [Siculibacillus sp.]|nr:hypothetical protein [Siculibacillus sp.]
MSASRIGLLVCAVAMVAVSATMLAWSVPHLAGYGGGQPFDIRFTGYDHGEAVAFLKALGPDGRAFYDTVQLRLDTAFPILYFVALSWLLAAILGWAGFDGVGRVVVACVVVAVPTLLDFAENAAIRDMLRRAPEAVDADLVARASWYSTRKWSMALVGLTIAALGVAVVLLRRRARTTP